jgi:hypothetical protein
MDRWEAAYLDSAVRKRIGGHEFELPLAEALCSIFLCMT